MRYLALWIVWITLYSVPMFLGDGYDLYFHFNQSLISAAQICIFLSISRHQYIVWLCLVSALAIGFNYLDSVKDYEADVYNTVMFLINATEVLLLIAYGKAHGACRVYQYLRSFNLARRLNLPHNRHITRDNKGKMA